MRTASHASSSTISSSTFIRPLPSSHDMPRRPEYERETLRYERLVAVVGEDQPTGPARPCRTARLRRTAVLPPSLPPRPGALRLHDNRPERTGETFEYWESPIHGLGHLDLSDRRSFRPRRRQCRRPVPAGTTTVAIIDDLPNLELSNPRRTKQEPSIPICASGSPVTHCPAPETR
jgi:hypothetical protein